MRRSVLLCFLAAVAFACPASAQEFLAPNERDFTQLLPAPPTNDSPAGLADLDTLLHLQQERTPAQVKRALKISAQSEFAFGAAVLGGWFNAKNLPRTAAIFKEIDRENDGIVQAAKKAVRRPRPYQRDLRVVPAVPKPNDASSYPSGHSAGAAVWGTILAAAFPDHSEAFQNQISETMWCRQIGGVHFPSDTEAGRLLGNAVGRRMLASSAMTKALEEIRAEAAPFLAQKSEVPTASNSPGAELVR